LSLKEDIDGVKKEIDSEEKFLTTYFKVEQWVKKYKTALLSVLLLSILSFAAYKGYEAYNDSRIWTANEAYTKLQKNPNDKAALEALKEKSTPLYEAYMLQKSSKDGNIKELEALKNSKNRVISDIAAYESAIASKNPKLLAGYGAKDDAFYRDFALLVSANELIKEKNYKKARETLNKIGVKSGVKEYADYLYHSILTLE